MEDFTNLNMTFSVKNMQFEVHPPEWQKKGALIQDINTIQTSLGKEPIGMKQFEELMNCSLDRLTQFVSDQASLLERAQSNHSF